MEHGPPSSLRKLRVEQFWACEGIGSALKNDIGVCLFFINIDFLVWFSFCHVNVAQHMSGKIRHQKLNFYHLCIHARKCFWFTNKECLTQHCSPSTWHYTISFGFYVNILYHIRRREISYWDHIFWFYGSFWNFKLFHYTDTFHFFCELEDFVLRRRRTDMISLSSYNPCSLIIH